LRSCSLASRSIGIFLRRIAQSGHGLLAEHGVRVDVDLGVERHEVARLGDDQRIDLEQRRIALEIDAVQRREDGLELAHLRALEAEAEGELAALVRLQPAPGLMSTRRIFSGSCAATSSMSMPPAAEAMTATRPRSRFSVSDR
jgi:hypothetical protein